MQKLHPGIQVRWEEVTHLRDGFSARSGQTEKAKRVAMPNTFLVFSRIFLQPVVN